ncbi:hypothetical protein ABZ719_02775 [Streptomyces sp. NPDC006743]|uniref:hypothetical protein n=1 Tax=Streptomyces sp. NPDC006743 TaxID=3154480 RepID=UPI0034568CAB
MVDTMALLPPFIRPTRMAGTPVGAAARPLPGLPADDEVLLDAPDDRLGPALVAAARDDWEPAARLLAGTRERAEWEDRDRYAHRLAAFARSRGAWLDAWRAAAPDDPDVLLLTAQLAVDRAWPSPARAELLREVSPLITAAARADDRDPVPWRVALDHARGSRAGHRYFEELWEAAVRRAPHHHGCHVAALRYLAGSCRVPARNTHGTRGPHTPGARHDSLRACFDFADRAAQDAPADALVQGLPVRAAFACLAEDGPGVERAGVERARLDAAADRAIALSARCPAATPRYAELRNLLTYVLVRLGRHQDALAQLRLIGPYATSYPWDRVSDDPLGLFLELRADVRSVRLGPVPDPPDSGETGRGRRAGTRGH